MMNDCWIQRYTQTFHNKYTVKNAPTFMKNKMKQTKVNYIHAMSYKYS